jgi:hypothetical protein
MDRVKAYLEDQLKNGLLPENRARVDECLAVVNHRLLSENNLELVPQKCDMLDGASGCHNSCCGMGTPCPLPVNCFNVGAPIHKPRAPRDLYEEMEDLIKTLCEGEDAGRWPKGTSTVASCFHTKLLEFRPVDTMEQKMLQLVEECNGVNCHSVSIMPPQRYPNSADSSDPIIDVLWGISIQLPDAPHEERYAPTLKEASHKVMEILTELRTQRFMRES